MPVADTLLPSGDADAIAVGLRNRDPAAAALLVDRFADAVYRYAFYRVRDVQTAEDIMADVLARVIEKIDTYSVQPGVSFRAWVFRIAHNRVIDHYRAQAKQPVQSMDRLRWAAEIASDETENYSTADTFTEVISTRHILLAALADLPDDQRRVVVARFIEDRDLDEVARIMGKSLPAIKALQFRAIQNLRRSVTAANSGEVVAQRRSQ